MDESKWGKSRGTIVCSLRGSGLEIDWACGGRIMGMQSQRYENLQAWVMRHTPWLWRLCVCPWMTIDVQMRRDFGISSAFSHLAAMVARVRIEACLSVRLRRCIAGRRTMQNTRESEGKAGFGQKGDITRLPSFPNSHSDRLSTPAKPNSADPMWREMLHTIHVAANQ